MGQRPRGPRGGRAGRRGLALGRQLQGSQDGARRRGRGPGPPRSCGGKTETQPDARRPARPCPARRRAAPPSVARWPPPPPPAPPRPQPPRRADESPPPTVGPPFACPPARPPGTRPAPPLAAAHRAEADPAGWLRRHLERITKPGPASAAIRLGGGWRQMWSPKARPLPGRSARVTPPTHFRFPALWNWECREGKSPWGLREPGQRER